MKITDIETIPIQVPMKPGMTLSTSHGEHTKSPYVIVRVRTDEGVTGLGEATVTSVWSGETGPACVGIIQGIIKPLLLGQDPRQIVKLRRAIDGAVRFNPFTKAAIEMALWDIAGKAAGVPVHQLLGGKVRDELPIKMVIGSFDVAKSVELAKRFLDWGVDCLKVKVGRDPIADEARVRAVRQTAGPNIPLSIDANCGWSVSQATRMLGKLKQYDLLVAEQPISTADPAQLAILRQRSEIPIMADESVFTLSDAWHITQHRAADVISVYPGKQGGLLGTLEVANVAKAAGIVCTMGSNLELGIATAAMLHVGAVCPTIACDQFPGDFIGPLYHESDLLKTPLELGPKASRVPDGPGLGVELDEEALEKYRDTSGLAQTIGETTDTTFEG